MRRLIFAVMAVVMALDVAIAQETGKLPRAEATEAQAEAAAEDAAEAAAPIAEAAAPVAEAAAPVAEVAASVAEAAAPVAETVAPVTETSAPAAETAAPIGSVTAPETSTNTARATGSGETGNPSPVFSDAVVMRETNSSPSLFTEESSFSSFEMQ